MNKVCYAGLLVLSSVAWGQTMNRYGAAGLAWNQHEELLTPANVKAGSFSKLWSYYVDGAVYAQPLYLPGTPNRLYVATMNDKVYAFDADKSGAPLWTRDLTGEANGVTPVPITDITNDNELNVVGNVGIESTPIIDTTTGSLFLVARTKEHGKYVQRLHRLDLQDGRDQVPPVILEASVPGTAPDAVNGMVSFDPRAGHQRPALALSKGNVFIAWASHEDLRPYHGWIMTYDAQTLKQTGALCITPNGSDGGVWQSGRAPAVAEDGSVYYEVGNGSWDGTHNFGNSVLKLQLSPSGLAVTDFYTPHDYQHQNDTDADLGSSGPLLLPHSQALLCGNKQGQLFVLDRADLGKMTPEDKGIRSTYDVRGGRVMSGPAFWDGPAGPTLFLWNESSVLRAISIDLANYTLTPTQKASVPSPGSPGGSLTISSNGKQPRTGIVWATVGRGRSADHGNAPGTLYAFDAETLQQLWSSETNAKSDRLGTLVKFVPPTVASGKVYVPNYDNAVNVYGLTTH